MRNTSYTSLCPGDEGCNTGRGHGDHDARARPSARSLQLREWNGCVEVSPLPASRLCRVRKRSMRFVAGHVVRGKKKPL